MMNHDDTPALPAELVISRVHFSDKLTSRVSY